MTKDCDVRFFWWFLVVFFFSRCSKDCGVPFLLMNKVLGGSQRFIRFQMGF